MALNWIYLTLAAYPGVSALSISLRGANPFTFRQKRLAAVGPLIAASCPESKGYFYYIWFQNSEQTF